MTTETHQKKYSLQFSEKDLHKSVEWKYDINWETLSTLPYKGGN